MTADRPPRTWAGAAGIPLLIAVFGVGCAATLTESEPAASRSPQVVGLEPVPLAPPPVTAVGAEAGAEPAPADEGGSGGEVPNNRASVGGCPARMGPHAIKRSALLRALDAGLGTWLRGVDVEPKLERGRFQGWLVRSVFSGDPCWAEVDLRAGDVVTRVNRRPIERPEEAQVVWTTLRTAGEIVVDLLRDGRPRTLRFTVSDGAVDVPASFAR